MPYRFHAGGRLLGEKIQIHLLLPDQIQGLVEFLVVIANGAIYLQFVPNDRFHIDLHLLMHCHGHDGTIFFGGKKGILQRPAGSRSFKSEIRPAIRFVPNECHRIILIHIDHMVRAARFGQRETIFPRTGDDHPRPKTRWAIWTARSPRPAAERTQNSGC